MSFKSSSITAPKIILASSSAAEVITLAASLTSLILKSIPPVIVKTIPRAPSIDMSNKLELIAARAASTARFSPLAWPIPIKAEPALDMTALTSAKSALMTPGTVIISAIP